MDGKSDSPDEPQKIRSPPARPPPPAKVKSADSIDLEEDKSPQKALNKPEQSSFGKLGIPPSVQKHLDELRALQKHRVRWFYKEGKKWVPFNGRDSLVIEEEWQALQNEEIDCDIEKSYGPTVRGRLFEVDIKGRVCHPLYWKGLLPFCTNLLHHCTVSAKSLGALTMFFMLIK